MTILSLLNLVCLFDMNCDDGNGNGNGCKWVKMESVGKIRMEN